MIKHCQQCGATFTPAFAHPHQKYCSQRCQMKAANMRRLKSPTWFEREWKSWLRDFANGKTTSNLRSD